ncbi:MAG TPA: alkaline phosphatase family protein [Caulobacteraceae bacterium]|jgi:arylsulfatase A-like enzyme
MLIAAAAAAGMTVGACSDWMHPKRHNVILFVADGLRSQIVTPQTAPALAAVRAEGVDFQNSHALFPTVTTANASAMATGHYLGDTGDFGNYLYTGPNNAPQTTNGVTPSLEDDADLNFVNQTFGGNYLNEDSLLATARAQGFQTASIGKKGPTSVHDMTARDGKSGIVIDDSSGWPAPDALPFVPEIKAAIKAAGLALPTPDRGLNTDPGAYNMAGVKVANVEQQTWFAKVATDVILPRFKKDGRPFVMVFWSRDPDGTQHNQGDSLNQLTPGINGPTTMAGIRNASDDLQRLRDALKAQGLDKTTDVVVTADHGFTTISKQSRTSASAKLAYRDVVPGFLPVGFLAIDLAQWLKVPVWQSNGLDVQIRDGFHPGSNGALIGPDPAHPQIVVAVNGGADLLYFPGPDAKAMAAKAAEFLMGQDYTAAVFVNDALGPVPGALPMSAVNLIGSARTPQPSMVVSFRTESSGCAEPETCEVLVSDTDLQQGQGSHGSLSRGETHNFMAAVGPDFKAGFVDPAPVSNADLPWTIAKALGIQMKPKGKLVGRPIDEALKDGKVPAFDAKVMRSDKGPGGFETVLDYQQVGEQKYFDAAGMPGRVFGLKP